MRRRVGVGKSQKDGGATEEETQIQRLGQSNRRAGGSYWELLSQDATGINSLSGWREGCNLRMVGLHPVQVPFDPFCLTQEVPDPTKYFVTRWSTDPWIQMAYSFVKTGGSGEAYDILAEEIQGTVFFAGEVGFITPTPITFIWITCF